MKCVAISLACGLAVWPPVRSPAQATRLVVTGDSAASRLVYRGRPLHPFCLDFPAERVSRAAPIVLASCSDTAVAVQLDSGGWRRAQHRAPETPRIVGYRALASVEDRFLVATESYGYGSGQFSKLFWVRLGSDRVAVVRDVAAGDRCGGGLTGYTVDQSAVLFTVTTPARDVIRLAGVSVPDSVRPRLRNGYYACDGDALYRYDPASQRRVLLSLTLDTTGAHIDALPRSDGQSREAAQICFDRLVLDYVVGKRQTLSVAELRAFGQAFLARCA